MICVALYSSPQFDIVSKQLIQSWYLLGPVTRFLTVGEEVHYEIAQKKICAVRTSAGTDFPGIEDIKVICVETVSGFLHSSKTQNQEKLSTCSEKKLTGFIQGNNSAKPSNTHRSTLHNSIKRSTQFQRVLPRPRTAATESRLHQTPLSPQHQIRRPIQLENNGRRIPRMLALPVHPPLILNLLPPNILHGLQPRKLLTAHRGPQKTRRRTLPLLLS